MSQQLARWIHVGAILLALGIVSQVEAGNTRRTAVVEVVEHVRAAVVNIHSERTVQGPATEDLFALAPSQNRMNGMGTGVLIDPRGYVVTNQHVVEDVNAIRVRLSDGTTHTARVLARDTESDLALLKIDLGRALPTIPLGTVKDLMVGETVIAIGNAYGYEHTVTVGVVSAVKRDVTLNKELSYKGLIQTDASINPGNSGGPLLNINGELIGINVAIRAGAQGISFAIPVDSMIRSVSEMMSIRKRNGTWHGLLLKDEVLVTNDKSDPKVEQAGSSPAESSTRIQRSVLVEKVEPQGPAEQAGLQPGDVVVQVADQRVACSLDLERALLDRGAKEHVTLVVLRKGEEQRLDLVLQPLARTAPSAAGVVWRKLGVRLSQVTGELSSHSNFPLHGGMAVDEVQSDGLAARAGIQRGDILVGLHQWETLNLENVVFVLTHPDLANFNPLKFYILRAGQVHRGWFHQVN